VQTQLGERRHGAQAASEQSVVVGVVNPVAGPRTSRTQRSRHHVSPDIHVVGGIADHRGLARSSTGSVNAHDFIHRHGEHAERIACPEILLRGERKEFEVFKPLQVRWMNLTFLAFLPKADDIVVGVLQ